MNDIVNPCKRSSMMSRIKGRDTKPELQVRRYLHACGFRFRLHRKDLPGRPDIVLPKYRLVIFVHGCFWHRHPGCHYATVPATRTDFWQRKFEGNVHRDQRSIERLLQNGWRVFVIWECGLRHQLEELRELPALIVGDESSSTWPAKPPKHMRPRPNSLSRRPHPSDATWFG
ncbi:very short patch repair endonuclease [Salinisphaera shabanensis]|uniref:very short patch repair endonuclease n=1 Tax=Salinisphaera shabanensis TaxID=180542 RepID=UPI00021212B1|nr:DNA mismatch endonuclease Vsr [Salinisphaera shabanensis]